MKHQIQHFYLKYALTAWLLTILLAPFTEGCSKKPILEPTPGTIIINTNDSPVPSWRLTGPAGFDTTAVGPDTLTSMPAGIYQISWLPLEGWFPPQASLDQLTRNLQHGGSVVFSGSYIQFIRITTDIGTDTDPVWSPDGNKIAFSSDRSGNFDIWVATLRNQREVESLLQVTTSETDDVSPDWAKHGDKIVYAHDYFPENHLPWVSPDGTLSGIYGGGEACLDSINSSPVFSPDDSKVACLSSRFGYAYFITIFETEYYGCDTYSFNCESMDGNYNEIAWANTSDTFLFSYWLEAAPSVRIGIGTTASTECTAIVSGRNSNIHPSWSPDDQYICYSSRGTWNSTSWEIWISKAVPDQVAIQVTPTGFLDFEPSWSPDGTTIAFASDRGGDGNMDIWLVSVPSLE